MVHPNHSDLPKRQTAAPATTAKKKDAQPEIRANNLPEKVSMGKVDDLLEKRVGTTFFRNASNWMVCAHNPMKRKRLRGNSMAGNYIIRRKLWDVTGELGTVLNKSEI